MLQLMEIALRIFGTALVHAQSSRACAALLVTATLAIPLAQLAGLLHSVRSTARTGAHARAADPTLGAPVSADDHADDMTGALGLLAAGDGVERRFAIHLVTVGRLVGAEPTVAGICLVRQASERGPPALH